MTRYLISFPAAAMVVRDVELERASRDSHAVIAAAKAAVYMCSAGASMRACQ